KADLRRCLLGRDIGWRRALIPDLQTAANNQHDEKHVEKVLPVHPRRDADWRIIWQRHVPGVAVEEICTHLGGEEIPRPEDRQGKQDCQPNDDGDPSADPLLQREATVVLVGSLLCLSGLCSWLRCCWLWRCRSRWLGRRTCLWRSRSGWCAGATRCRRGGWCSGSARSCGRTWNTKCGRCSGCRRRRRCWEGRRSRSCGSEWYA